MTRHPTRVSTGCDAIQFTGRLRNRVFKSVLARDSTETRAQVNCLFAEIAMASSLLPISRIAIDCVPINSCCNALAMLCHTCRPRHWGLPPRRHGIVLPSGSCNGRPIEHCGLTSATRQIFERESTSRVAVGDGYVIPGP